MRPLFAHRRSPNSITTRSNFCFLFSATHLPRLPRPSRIPSIQTLAQKPMRTPEGKQRSSHNATTHGLCSNRLILPDEDEQEWLAMKQGWLDSYQPETHVALKLVWQLAEAEWLFLRARRRYNEAEQQLYTEQENALLWTEEQQKTIDRFTRYRTTYERAFHRALRNVEDLRRSRSLEAARIAHAEFRIQESERKSRQSENKPSRRKADPPEPLEQWIEIAVEDGKPVTKLFPPNDELLKKVQEMGSPPDSVHRRLHFVNGIPAEYHWTAQSTPELFETGGAGIQRMKYDTWLEVIQREEASGTGHIGPTGVGNLPRPESRGGCDCHVCSHNREILERIEDAS